MGQEMSYRSGMPVALDEIADMCRERAAAQKTELGPWFRPSAVLTFHPLALTKPARWENALAMVMFAISGKSPRRDEVLPGREVLARLSRSARRMVEPSDVLGLLASLLVGFRLSDRGDFVQEANRYVDAAETMGRLLRTDPLQVEIPLCAHRAPRSLEPRRLAREPDHDGIRRACALIRLVLDNARVAHGQVRFLQQTATERASSCMFPSVFLEYVVRGELELLMGLLTVHEKTVRRVADQYTSESVRFSVEPLDGLSIEAEKQLESTYGAGWRRIGADRLADALAAETADRERAAVEDALRHVRRFMPELGQMRGRRPILGSGIPTSHRAAGDWFFERSDTSAAGKALFEVAFYRRWAERTRATGSISLGFDRDWSRYQRDAWLLAYDGGPDSRIPLLYARRNTDVLPGRALRNLSYRQFWLPIKREMP